MGYKAESNAIRLLLEARDSIELDDPNFTLKPVYSNYLALYSTFYEYVNRYIYAITNDIIHLRRHSKMLMAWQEVKGEIAEIFGRSVLEGVAADLVEPTFKAAIDLPIEVKEKIYQCCWRAALLARDGIGSVEEIASNETERNSAYKLFLRHYIDCAERDTLIELTNNLYGSSEDAESGGSAKHLDEMHGAKHHDVMPPLLGKYPKIKSEIISGMVIVHTGLDSLDLGKELQHLERQRHVAQDAYHAFIGYIDAIIRSGLSIS